MPKIKIDMDTNIYIGTSGWSYTHWVGTFYPVKTNPAAQLGYYIKYFRTVETNNSFYKLPAWETFANWSNSVPEDFLFVVKASRFITHMKKLKDPAASIFSFMENVMGLGSKLGPILFQLPPHWKINIQRLEEFLSVLPPGLRYAFEFRNPTWYSAEVYALLKKHNCAFCIYELNGHLSPKEVIADFVYLRLHGPDGSYQGSYSEQELAKWARQSRNWAQHGDVYVYFDNDQMGFAPANAKRLIELVA